MSACPKPSITPCSWNLSCCPNQKQRRWGGREENTSDRNRRYEWDYQRKSQEFWSRPSLFLLSYCTPWLTKTPNGTTKAASFTITSPSASSPIPTCSAFDLVRLTSSKAISFRFHFLLPSPMKPPSNRSSWIPVATSKKTVSQMLLFSTYVFPVFQIHGTLSPYVCAFAVSRLIVLSRSLEMIPYYNSVEELYGTLGEMHRVP